MVGSTYEHLHNLHGFGVDDDVLSKLKGTRFENILCLQNIKKLNSVIGLVEYIVGVYDIKSNCFNLPGDIKLYFGLEDAFHIWGLPIFGLPILGKKCKELDLCNLLFPEFVYRSPPDSDDEDEVDECVAVIRMRRDKLLKKGSGFKCKKLRGVATARANSLETRVRATVLYLLGSVFVADKSACTSAHYGQFLTDIDRIGQYSWGEMLMVSIHEGIHNHKMMRKGNAVKGDEQGGSAVKDDDKAISGSVFTLMIFIILHVKSLHALFGISEDGFAINGWPVIKEVAAAIQEVTANSNNKLTRERIEEKMAACTKDDIIWRPYPSLHIPSHYEIQQPFLLALTPVFKEKICVFHTPHLAPRQYEISGDQVDTMAMFLKEIKIKKRGYYLSVKGRRGGAGNKSFLKKWNEKLKVTVSECRKRVLTQNWLTLSDDLNTLVQDAAEALQETDDIDDRMPDGRMPVDADDEERMPASQVDRIHEIENVDDSLLQHSQVASPMSVSRSRGETLVVNHAAEIVNEPDLAEALKQTDDIDDRMLDDPEVESPSRDRMLDDPEVESPSRGESLVVNHATDDRMPDGRMPEVDNRMPVDADGEERMPASQVDRIHDDRMLDDPEVDDRKSQGEMLVVNPGTETVNESDLVEIEVEIEVEMEVADLRLECEDMVEVELPASKNMAEVETSADGKTTSPGKGEVGTSADGNTASQALIIHSPLTYRKRKFGEDVYSLSDSDLNETLGKPIKVDAILTSLNLQRGHLKALIDGGPVNSEVIAAGIQLLNSEWNGCEKHAVNPYTSYQIFSMDIQEVDKTNSRIKNKLSDKAKEADILSSLLRVALDCDCI